MNFEFLTLLSLIGFRLFFEKEQFFKFTNYKKQNSYLEIISLSEQGKNEDYLFNKSFNILLTILILNHFFSLLKAKFSIQIASFLLCVDRECFLYIINSNL